MMLALVAMVLGTQVLAQSKQTYAVYTEGDGTISNPNTLTFYYDDQKSSRPGTKYDLNTGNTEPGWYKDHISDIQRVDFDESFKDARPTSTYRWFSCFNLTELVRLSYLNTSEVTNMSYMFSGSKLSSIDLTYFDTSKVTTMESMFDSCSQLITVNVSSFNTSNVTNMERMFNWCTELTYLNLASFNTKNIECFDDMFFYCSKLQTIYVNSDWFKPELACSMFAECSQLVGGEGTHYEDYKWSNEFARVDGGDSKPGYFTQIPSGYAVFEGDSLTFYNDGKMSMKEGEKYLLNVAVDLPVWCREKGIEKVVFDKSFATARPNSFYNWFGGFSILAEIKGWQYLNTSEVTTMNGMFSSCSRITNLDLSHFNTSKVTDMAAMFIGCGNLKEINLLSFDTSNVTTMGVMFSGCNSLETLNLGSFNTKKVTEMRLMFSSCGKLKTIYVGENWSVDNEESNCWAMFGGCNNLEGEKGTKCDGGWVEHKTYAHIDGGPSNQGYLSTAPLIEAYAVLSDDGKTLTFYCDANKSSFGTNAYELNTENNYPGWYKDWSEGENPNKIKKVVFDSSFKVARPTSTYHWFAYQEQLTEIIDIDYLNTSQVTNMDWMFSNCFKLKHIELSGFDTQNVTDITGIFNSCYSLTGIDLSGFKTSKVTNMDYMFYSCSSITNLNVSNFDTSSVTDMYCMFSGCSNLTSLNLSNFKTDKVTASMAHMFEGCSKLVTLDLTSFNTSNVSAMDWMFNECTELKTIYVGDQWNIKSSASGYCMFDGCISLVGENGTTYDENHTGIAYAHIDGIDGPGYLTLFPEGYAVFADGVLTFYNDGKMEEKSGKVFPLNVGDNTPEWFEYTYYSNSVSIQKVVFDESFATARPISTVSWFANCAELTDIVGIEYLNTSNVTNMVSMFQDCSKITSLDLSHFNTSKVTNMSTMFLGCSDLETLNLGSFNTSNVTEMVMMFTNCENLQTIYVGSNWKAADQCWSMFKGCNSLVGGQGTKFIETEYEPGMNTFAHIDGGPSNRGYLTAAPVVGIATNLNQVTSDKSQVTSDEWYTIDGRKLNGKPAKKGMYIHNGKKAVLKN